MLTLREALRFSCFEKARVVAGAAGLDNVVRRVHVVDIPDAGYAWGEGALLLTAGYGLRDSPERQAQLVPTLVEHQLVGMVFATGWYFPEVPDVIREAAEAHGFPVIETPREVEFISITEQLYTEIVSHQSALRERAAEIHRQLTRLVLEGGNLAAVTETLARILQRSVLIESPASDVLAAAQFGPVDEGRLRVVEAGRTPPDRAQRLLKRGIYADLQQKRQAVRLPPMPDLGWTMERVVAPIVVGGEIYGYIWIVEGDRPLTELDELAVDHTATVAALMLLQERAVRDAQQSLRGDLLSQLLHLQSEADSALHERARVLGYRVDQPHQVLFVIAPPVSGATEAQLVARVDNWLHGHGEHGLSILRERGLALVIEARNDPAGEALAGRLLAELNHPNRPVYIGVGRVYPGERSLRRSYDEALEAATIACRLGPGPRVLCFWELGLLDWLYRLPPEVVRRNPYLDVIEKLARHDERTNGDLVRTLEAYLAYGGALAEAAGALTVHRNTLLYRLGRIEEIAGVDLRNVDQRINLHVALKAYRLQS
jgi:PucR family transcriptional regulator, purine catabolism regulatory protein